MKNNLSCIIIINIQQIILVINIRLRVVFFFNDGFMAMPHNSISFLTCLKVVQVSVDSIFVERVVVEVTIVRVHLTCDEGLS